MPNLPRVYVVRHGETEWSRSGQHTGTTDLPLTPQGEAEARDAGRRLAGVVFAHVLTSPRVRARQACALALPDAAPRIDDDLAEWNYGEYEGQRSVDIRERRPGWNLFRDGCPSGESPAEVGVRADGIIDRLNGLEGNIALFAHGDLGRVLGARWIGLAVSQAQSLLLGTGSISVLSYEHADRDHPAIAQWNERSPRM